MAMFDGPSEPISHCISACEANTSLTLRTDDPIMPAGRDIENGLFSDFARYPHFTRSRAGVPNAAPPLDAACNRPD